MIRVINYEEHHRSSIIALRKDPATKAALWKWEFEESSRLLGRPFEPVLLADDDRVVGFNGVLPVELKYVGQIVEALWSCDFFVDPEYRGHGLGKQLKTELIRKAPLIMSLGVSHSASIVLRKMGWRSVKVPSFRRVVSKNRMPFLRKLKQTLFQTLQLFNRITHSRTPRLDLNVELSGSLPEVEQVSALLDRVLPSYEKTVLRSHQYLSWKYERHPLAKYEFLTARQPGVELVGLMVIRRSGNSVKIVDYLGPKNSISLKRSLVYQCCLSYPDAAQFSVTVLDQEFVSALKSEGFYGTRFGMELFVRSSMGELNPEEGWFVMGGDSDGELLAASRESGNIKKREVKNGGQH